MIKTGKIILKGKIRLLSPAMIGSGRDERTDMDITRDSDGKPFIPATSFIGVLRHSLKVKADNEQLERFWGSEKKKDKPLYQSALYCDDLTIIDEKPEIAIRDGVAIDNKTGRAKEHAKFNYELIEKDTTFDLKMEIDLIKGYEEFFKQMLATIIHVLKNEKIRLGAKTRNGFGKIKLEDYKVYEFDFRKKDGIVRWLKEDFTTPSDFKYPVFIIDQNNLFELNATFSIKNSLIVRSYTASPDEPDSVHIKSKGKDILPGTSIKGAIRARAERIINTLGKPSDIIIDLFGLIDENKKEAKRGRLIIEEIVLDGYPSEVQTRIKIDRFTGGVMEGALLETMPLFSTKNSKTFNLSITIEDCKPHEAGLMLLILKDLWTEDLPVGGEKAIGRGVLKGIGAEINYNGETFKIPQNITQIPDPQKKKLQEYVDSLVNYIGGAA
jgi:CRISPR/Cas system CSM-associated protein Csm3 (group 7 of RAMP superfamily)